MGEDISRQTIVILVVLAVLISLLGTWTVLTEVSRIKIKGNEVATANVKLNIVSPEELKSSSHNYGRKTTSGMVVLNIKPPVKG